MVLDISDRKLIFGGKSILVEVVSCSLLEPWDSIHE